MRLEGALEAFEFSEANRFTSVAMALINPEASSTQSLASAPPSSQMAPALAGPLLAPRLTCGNDAFQVRPQRGILLAQGEVFREQGRRDREECGLGEEAHVLRWLEQF